MLIEKGSPPTGPPPPPAGMTAPPNTKGIKKTELKPKHEARSGWEEDFKKMHENGDDKLLINDLFDDENLEEWN